jgi:hypothetical protein
MEPAPQAARVTLSANVMLDPPNYNKSNHAMM